jgi:adenylate kinase family enzyme
VSCVIYCLVGKSCSGKSTVAKYLKNKYNFKLFEVSDFIRQKSLSNPQFSINEIFSKFGTTFVADEICKLVKKNELIVISGFRSPKEIKKIRKFDKYIVIGIYSEDITCFKRNLKRNRHDSKITFEKFYKEVICPEYSMGLIDIFRFELDFFLKNTKIKNLFNSIDKIINESLN